MYFINFQQTHSSVNPYLASILVCTVRFLMSIVNTYMLKRFHRRPLIMVSGLGMCMCMLFSGFFTKWILEGKLTINLNNSTKLLCVIPIRNVGNDISSHYSSTSIRNHFNDWITANTMDHDSRTIPH